ncbi:hypothetical protein C8T65DRAFT_199066 [Cerioporus squamosus]|nr:hypothetical protein C8T65DRAFT_199066 [Cerioporus squamosus]
MSGRQGGKAKPLKVPSPAPLQAASSTSPLGTGSQEGQEGVGRGGRRLQGEEEAGGGRAEGCACTSCEGRCPRWWHQEVRQEVKQQVDRHAHLHHPSSTRSVYYLAFPLSHHGAPTTRCNVGRYQGQYSVWRSHFSLSYRWSSQHADARA